MRWKADVLLKTTQHIQRAFLKCKNKTIYLETQHFLYILTWNDFSGKCKKACNIS